HHRHAFDLPAPAVARDQARALPGAAAIHRPALTACAGAATSSRGVRTNRSFAGCVPDNPGGAVFATGLLGLLPLFGLGFAFFLPGAVPALLTLRRGARAGAIVAVGAALLLALPMWSIGRPIPVGFIYAGWMLGPPLLLALVLKRSESLSLCLQLAVLAAVAMLCILHGAFGDPAKFWSPFVRELAQEMERRGLDFGLQHDDIIDMLARTLWGWVTLLT